LKPPVVALPDPDPPVALLEEALELSFALLVELELLVEDPVVEEPVLFVAPNMKFPTWSGFCDVEGEEESPSELPPPPPPRPEPVEIVLAPENEEEERVVSAEMISE
jgi:hypothetical protein